VVGGGVTHHHLSTNHNSPRGQVVHKIVHNGVAPELLVIGHLIWKKKKIIIYKF